MLNSKTLEEELRERVKNPKKIFVRFRKLGRVEILIQFGALNRKNGYRNEKKQDLEIGIDKNIY